jgi:hypothetical protein
MQIEKLIAGLNALNLGELDGVRSRLATLGQACREIDQTELAAMLNEADTALKSADMKIYRKRLETVIARLGHLK